MEVTTRDYIRPRKLNKKEKSPRQKCPPPDQEDYPPHFLSNGYPHSSYPSPRLPLDPRYSINMLSSRKLFAKQSPVLSDEDAVLLERFASTGLDPNHGYAYSQHQCPLRDQLKQEFHHDARIGGYPKVPINVEKERGKCVTVRSKDFADRDVAAKYISHLIKNGLESWVFRMSDGMIEEEKDVEGSVKGLQSIED